MDKTGPEAAMLRALVLLDDIANSDAWMGGDDIEDLCEAREILASQLGLEYKEDTSRYTEAA